MQVFEVIITASVIGSLAWTALKLVLRRKWRDGEETCIKTQDVESIK